MECPNCKGELQPLSEAISMCAKCGWVIQPCAWGLSEPAPVQFPREYEPNALDRFTYAVGKLLEGWKLL